MRETSHKVKSFYRGIYSIGCPGVETMDLWDECQDCDFKTNVEVRQRRTPPTTVQKDWKIQFEIKDFDRSAKPAEVGFSWEALEKFVAEIQQDERNKVIEIIEEQLRQFQLIYGGFDSYTSDMVGYRIPKNEESADVLIIYLSDKLNQLKGNHE